MLLASPRPALPGCRRACPVPAQPRCRWARPVPVLSQCQQPHAVLVMPHCRQACPSPTLPWPVAAPMLPGSPWPCTALTPAALCCAGAALMPPAFLPHPGCTTMLSPRRQGYSAAASFPPMPVLPRCRWPCPSPVLPRCQEDRPATVLPQCCVACPAPGTASMPPAFPPVQAMPPHIPHPTRATQPLPAFSSCQHCPNITRLTRHRCCSDASRLLPCRHSPDADLFVTR